MGRNYAFEGFPNAVMAKPKRARRSEHLNFIYLFCGGKYDIVKDPKHPDRWHPVETFESMGLKQAIFEACERRTDAQSEQIRVRMFFIY